MKKTLTILASVFLFVTNAQVGVDTDNPQTTLHVEASPDDETLADGIMAPRLTGQQLRSKDALYEAAETDALVYVTEALVYDDPNVTEDPAIDPAVATSTKTQLVTEVGYYYFDGTIWQPLRIEPWNVARTTDKAKSVDQDIYHNGKVAIGQDFPGAAGQLAIRISDPSRQAIQAINFTTTDGIPERTYTNIQSVAYDFSTGTPDVPEGDQNSVGSMTGISSNVQDNATNINRGVTGVSSIANLGVARSSALQSIVGIESFASSSPRATGLTMKSVGGFFNEAALKGQGGTFEEVYGIKNDLYIIPADNRTANVDIMANVWAKSRFTGETTGGTQSGGTASVNVNKVYGILVEAETDEDSQVPSQRAVNIDESYGIYINDFNFRLASGSNTENAYNFFSEGEGNKNIFEGRVGIGFNQPAAKVHVVKEADATILTPVILEGLNTYADEAAATTAGMPSGGLYKDSNGFLKVKQ